MQQERFKAFRQSFNLTQDQLAEEITENNTPEEIEKTRNLIKRIELGQKIPPELALKLEKQYNINAQWLLTGAYSGASDNIIEQLVKIPKIPEPIIICLNRQDIEQKPENEIVTLNAQITLKLEDLKKLLTVPIAIACVLFLSVIPVYAQPYREGRGYNPDPFTPMYPNTNIPIYAQQKPPQPQQQNQTKLTPQFQIPNAYEDNLKKNSYPNSRF